ncbi:tyrosine-type recombinase/integrase [Flammeovirga sp. OC4]|uniref:tyrosine-type recombinase/integrase n=1 Tax=Flammeovirga sp. OC4 TaxID=1382345 RepID=UPI00155DDD8C|nr:tyrosine-type recombinase/integrase [Flammeovirga sp. OC4]
MRLNVTFYFRKLRTFEKTGMGVVMANISLNGKRASSGYHTGVKCKKEHFISGRIEGCKNANQLNESLFLCETHIRSVANNLCLTNKYLTANEILKYVRGINTDTSIERVLKLYIESREEFVSKNRFRHLKFMSNRIEKFTKQNKLNNIEEVTKIQLENIFVSLSQKGRSTNSIRQDITFFLKAINYFKAKFSFAGLNLPELGKLDIKASYSPSIIYLEMEELELIEKFQTTNEQQIKAKNWFLLACYTGMHYNEIKSYSPEKHLFVNDGQKYIKIQRSKTSKTNSRACIIPLTDKAVELLKKINGEHSKDFNNVTNLNFHLNKLRIGAGIEKPVTCKIGRKTFGTMMLLKGMSLESVSRMLGHSSIVTTQRYYVVVLEQRVFNEFKSLKF